MNKVELVWVHFNPTVNAEGTLGFQAHTVTKTDESSKNLNAEAPIFSSFYKKIVQNSQRFARCN